MGKVENFIQKIADEIKSRLSSEVNEARDVFYNGHGDNYQLFLAMKKPKIKKENGLYYGKTPIYSPFFDF